MNTPPSPRIVAEIDGALRPLFPTLNQGARSPSPSLAIEAHRGRISDWQTRTIRGHVLTLFIDPGHVLHCVDNSTVSRIAIPSQGVVISLRNQTESVSWLKDAQVLSVQVEDRVLADAAQALGIHTPFNLTANRGVRDTRLTALLRALGIEQASGYPSGRLFVDGIESALAALLVSGYADAVPSSTHLDCTLPPARAKLVEEFARDNLHVALTLKDLAERAGYSPSHFSRSFRATFGTTPHRFMVGLRVERAKELLKYSRLSTLEIALHCGFQTSQHFSRVFKCLAGVSPSDFRKRG
jgi:AraC family transcriptional regulator